MTGMAFPTLSDRFATALPEFAVPWAATEVPHPQLLVLNTSLAAELGLDADWLATPDGLRFLTGNAPAPGSVPVAQAYAGHQFGVFVPRLGDGRALLLGELRDPAGRLRDIHLKGSGRTPFSRGGDGLAATGPMLREFLMSEALHALGIPTTRSLAVVATDRAVHRDDAIDPLPGALLVRVASSHLRVGSFQYALTLRDHSVLSRLSEFAIERHSPECSETDRPALCLLRSVIDRQASLVAQWMLSGFVHGVMNTDNTTISGETIDFGPCAMLDAYDPSASFSSIDHQGRYAYGRQPGIISWNLTRFAETLLPLLANDADENGPSAEATEARAEEARSLAVGALQTFGARYDAAWIAGMRRKLGLAGRADVDDARLVDIAQGLLGDLHVGAIDYTSAFRALGAAARADEAPFRARFSEGRQPGPWFADWLSCNPDADAMNAANPVYIPRNHLVDAALDAATRGDLDPFRTLLDAVTDPFTERPGLDRYAAPPPPDAPAFVSYCGT